MSKRLSGKTAIVTAAAAGIGKSTVEYFVAEGATVWATDINTSALDDLVSEIPGLNICRLDVSNPQDIEDLYQKTGPVDVLFNCAGYVHNGNILDCEDDDWEFSYSLNVTACYRIIRRFLPGMIENGGGSIINVASVAGSIKAVPNRFCYSATKAAVIGMTKSIAADFVKEGIRCNAICPGTVDTPSLRDRLDSFTDPLAARKEFESRQPMGRLADPKEIAALALYLASDESAFTTGVAHVIDGGWCN